MHVAHLKTLTCNAFAANLKTFSLSTSMISWETDRNREGGVRRMLLEKAFLNPNTERCPTVASARSQDEPLWFFDFYVLKPFPLYSSQQTEKIVPCRHYLLCWGATRVQRQWITRELLSETQNQQPAESGFSTSSPRKTRGKHLRCRRRILHSGRTTQRLWCLSAVLCFLHKT